METFGLAFAYWLHILATVAWVGGQTTLAWLALPAARKVMEPKAYASFLTAVVKRLQGVGWLSLGVLFGTGMFQMSANPQYGGFLAIGNTWSVAIFIKHIAILGMIACGAATTWGILPAMQRQALRLSLGKEPTETLEGLARREARLANANLILGVVVLGLTALARAAQ